MLDFIVKALFAFAIVLVVLIVIALGMEIHQNIETAKHCEKWETKTVWQEPYTQYMMVGKVMVPFHHPGQWVEKEVCVKPKE